MSLFEFKLPDIGEGVMEGEIVAWHVQPGMAVREDDPMVEVMTDKATVTIGAPKSGTIDKLLATVGDVVAVGSVIVTLQTNGAGATTAATAKKAPDSARPRSDDGPVATAVGDIKESVPGAAYFAARQGAESAAEGEKVLATPATRKLARDLDVDLRAVLPSGPGGRVTKDDVRAFVTLAHERAVSQAPPARAPDAPTLPPRTAAQQTPTARPLVAIQAPSAASAELEERRPFVGIRRRIAERMQTSKNTAAHFTFVEECDVGRLKELRDRLTPRARDAGLKLSFLPFIVKAVVAALKKHPVLNSALDETTNELVTRRYYHVGIATATDQGLMVPVLRDADRKSLLEVAREIERLAASARDGSIAPAELTGSTFTVTSLGRQGGLFATPVLNFPEVGILGVHQIKQRPVVRDGAIEIGEIMLLSLSFDHRIVDGHIGAAFAYEIIGFLEDPDRLFLEMT